jgi:hypothetical protein
MVVVSITSGLLVVAVVAVVAVISSRASRSIVELPRSMPSRRRRRSLAAKAVSTPGAAPTSDHRARLRGHGPDPGRLPAPRRGPSPPRSPPGAGNRATCRARISVFTRSPEGRCNFDGTRHHTFDARRRQGPGHTEAGRTGLIPHHRWRRQRGDPRQYLTVLRRQSPLKHPPGLTFESTPGHQSRVHIQPDTPTLTLHRGLPHLVAPPTRTTSCRQPTFTCERSPNHPIPSSDATPRGVIQHWAATARCTCSPRTPRKASEPQAPCDGSVRAWAPPRGGPPRPSSPHTDIGSCGRLGHGWGVERLCDQAVRPRRLHRARHDLLRRCSPFQVNKGRADVPPASAPTVHTQPPRRPRRFVSTAPPGGYPKCGGG